MRQWMRSYWSKVTNFQLDRRRELKRLITPVIPALREAEVGGSVEAREFEISLGRTARPCLHKIQN